MTWGKHEVVGRRLPVLASVKALDEYFVEVIWKFGERSGRRDVVDLSPMILRYKMYEPLRGNKKLFSSACLGPYGSSIEWGRGEIDLSVVALEEMVVEADAHVDFKQFLEKQGWTFDTAASRLGLGRRTVAYYASGRQLPRSVALACKYFEGLRRDPLDIIDLEKVLKINDLKAEGVGAEWLSKTVGLRGDLKRHDSRIVPEKVDNGNWVQ